MVSTFLRKQSNINSFIIIYMVPIDYEKVYRKNLKN